MLEGTHLCRMIIDKAHELGIRVVIANWYSVDDAPAKAYADMSYTVDIFDVPAMMDIVKRENIDGIFTGFTDSHLHIYEKLCREAGMPCFTCEGLVDVMTDKALFKAKCYEAGLTVIDEYDVQRLLSDSSYAVGIEYPVIVKPVDNSGARGISICSGYASLKNAVDRARKFSGSGNVIVEKYWGGGGATNTASLTSSFLTDMHTLLPQAINR